MCTCIGTKYFQPCFLLQASRVRFRFEDDALEVVLGEQNNKSENKFVGGENRWKFSAFTNWEVSPCQQHCCCESYLG